jgi:hypothetical protein
LRQDGRVQDLMVNLIASVIAGVAVWSGQRLLRWRRLARKRAFFGLNGGETCLLSVARHFSSPSQLSVHRSDVAALVELAAVARDCGARADLVSAADLAGGIGRQTEFCVGGPIGNPRTAAHVRSILRGVAILPGADAAAYESSGRQAPITVGGVAYRREPDREEYVVLARAWGPDGGRPVFVLGGQTAVTNLAAARYLVTHYRELSRRYGADRRFCLVLRVVESQVYGPDFVEVAADVTAEAFEPYEAPALTADPDAASAG